MIRPDLLKDVFETLESHRYLSLEDFAIGEFENQNKQPCLGIEYRYDSNLIFKFVIPNQRTKRGESAEVYRYFCTMRPGRESYEESLSTEERVGLTSEIKDWLRRLYDDVVSAPAVRQFQEHARAIDQLKERLSVLPEEPISKSDVQAINDGLEKLKAELSEQLKRETDDKDDLRRRIDELTRDIDFLKGTLESMSKRQWGELLAVRVQRWKTRLSLRQISAGTKVLRLFLPSAASETLGAVTDAIDTFADAAEKTSPPKP